MKPLLRQMAVVFGLWTLVALSAGLADYAYLHAVGRSPSLLATLRRPLAEQWIWAALTPLVFQLARRVPLAAPHLVRAFVLRVVFFVALSALHCVIAEAIGAPLASRPPQWQGSTIVLRFLEEFYSDIWMYWPLVGIRALLDAQARERERELQASRAAQRLSELQLSLLRAQIQPHFLFNTLHAISALLRVDPRAAEDMVADLADILRASFAEGTSQEMPLRRELDLAGCYLRIQQRRLGERLAVDLQVDPAAADALVPALVLQSLIENAVVHGIAPLARPGRLTVDVRRVGMELIMEVRDDGAGIAAGPRSGLGLANARERLAQLYGSDQAFELQSKPGFGTAVKLRIPYRSASSTSEPAPAGHDHAHPHPDRGRRAAGAAEPVVAAAG